MAVVWNLNHCAKIAKCSSIDTPNIKLDLLQYLLFNFISENYPLYDCFSIIYLIKYILVDCTFEFRKRKKKEILRSVTNINIETQVSFCSRHFHSREDT